MPKVPGQNLARTEDGAIYNKLQRPDQWPTEPSSTPAATEDRISNKHGHNNEEADSPHDDSDQEFSQRSRKRKRVYKLRRADECLPLDDEDFSDIGDDDVSFAAIQYLKGVRAEAQDLPDVSKMPSNRALSEEHHRGYYEDGVYVVAPQIGPNILQDYYDDQDYAENGGDEAALRSQPKSLTAIEAYTDTLMLRFRSLRDKVRALRAQHSSVMDTNISSLKVANLRKLERKERVHWQAIMRTDCPKISELAVTSLPAVLSLISIIKDQCLSRKKNIGKNITLWAMVLLASVDDRTVDSETIYDLRDLAKKAIWLRIDFEARFAEVSEAMAREAGYLSDNEESSDAAAQINEEADVQEEDREILSDLLIDEIVPDDTTKATLDMIVTIVGEGFGQRDLLESRSVIDWPSQED